jgi:bacillithiol system protein YtxJ
MAIDPIASLSTQPWWRAVQRAPIALIYKHSPICGASTAAHLEVSRFAVGNPAVPVCLVDVIRERGFARTIAEALDVPHASPQVIMLRAGAPAWVASHREIRAEALHEAVRNAEASPGSAETAGPGACRLRP